MALMRHNTSKITRFFDNTAFKWLEIYKRPQKASDLVLFDRANIAVEFVNAWLASGSKILDVGCGAGIVSMKLAQQGYLLHGVDISRNMVGLCHKSFAETFEKDEPHAFTAGNFLEIDLERESFDGIVALGFLEYQENEIGCVKRFFELLKPKGILVISGPMRWALTEFFGMRNIPRILFSGIFDRHISPFKNYYSLSRLSGLLRESGFNILDQKRHGFASFPIIGKVIGLNGEMQLSRILETLSSSLPLKTFCSDLVIIAGKGIN